MTEPAPDLQDLMRRLLAVEQRLDQEAGLRAAADRDLGDIAQTLRAQQHTIQALSITQSQHNDLLARQQQLLQRQADLLQQHGQLLDAHSRSLVTAHDKLDRIIRMLTTLTGEPDGAGQ